MGKNKSKRKFVTEFQKTESIMKKLDNMLNKEALAVKKSRENKNKGEK